VRIERFDSHGSIVVLIVRVLGLGFGVFVMAQAMTLWFRVVGGVFYGAIVSQITYVDWHGVMSAGIWTTCGLLLLFCSGRVARVVVGRALSAEDVKRTPRV